MTPKTEAQAIHDAEYRSYRHARYVVRNRSKYTPGAETADSRPAKRRRAQGEKS